MRVESREAIPKLARWLHEAKGIEFRRETAVLGVAPGTVRTSSGTIRAARIVVAPGDDFHTLFEDRIAAYGVTRCKLHMMRVADPAVGTLPGSVMTDLSLGRYLGYAELPEAEPLKARLAAEQAEHLANGVHLIVVQSADGSLVVGDSHHYAATPDPFAPEAVDDLILDEYAATFDGRPARVLERWTGTYASAPDRLRLHRPAGRHHPPRHGDERHRRLHRLRHRRGGGGGAVRLTGLGLRPPHPEVPAAGRPRRMPTLDEHPSRLASLAPQDEVARRTKQRC